MSEKGQMLPKRDVRVRSVYPSISDIILRRPERREGPMGDIDGGQVQYRGLANSGK